VVLLFDRKSQAVGLKPASSDIRYAHPIRRQSNSESYLVSAKPFLTYYDIDTSRTVAFRPQAEDGVLVFELKKGIGVIRRGGRKKGARKRRRRREATQGKGSI
jgi:hypothetical protein